jgi:proline iminopeptidase
VNRQHFLATASASLAVLAVPGPVGAANGVAGRYPAAGGSLGYRRFGTSGPVWVLLSGGPGLESSYVDPIAIELARNRTIVVLDQRGTGSSRDAFGDGSQVTVAGAVADLEGLRTELDLPRLSLIGHSWGAMLSMAYAAMYGNRVASLALLDPGGPDPSFFGAFGARIQARLTPEDTAAAEALQKAGKPPNQAILPGYFHDRAKGVAFAAAVPEHFDNPDVTKAMFNDVGAHYDVKAALRGTPIPTLLVYGSDDPSRVVEAQLDTLFPHAVKAVIADAGHFPWIENPTPFYAAIRTFLSGTITSRAG